MITDSGLSLTKNRKLHKLERVESHVGKITSTELIGKWVDDVPLKLPDINIDIDITGNPSSQYNL